MVCLWKKSPASPSPKTLPQTLTDDGPTMTDRIKQIRMSREMNHQKANPSQNQKILFSNAILKQFITFEQTKLFYEV